MSPLSLEDRRALLGLARMAISVAIIERKVPDVPALHGALAVPMGAFVTLERNRRLRGCVGIVENPERLGETVMRAAIGAALHDSRFSPLAAEEIPDLDIEISVLSPLKQTAPDAIVVERHGLMVVSEGRRGLLLPQVAGEHNWTALRFLEETCMKAGLPRDAWKAPATKIFIFTAEIFQRMPCAFPRKSAVFDCDGTFAGFYNANDLEATPTQSPRSLRRRSLVWPRSAAWLPRPVPVRMIIPSPMI